MLSRRLFSRMSGPYAGASVLAFVLASSWSQIGHTAASKSIPFCHDCLEKKEDWLLGSPLFAGRQASDIMGNSLTFIGLIV